MIAQDLAKASSVAATGDPYTEEEGKETRRSAEAAGAMRIKFKTTAFGDNWVFPVQVS